MPSLCLVRSSINIDETFAVPHIVRPGETLSSTGLESRPGGKGANVSAAVALAGAKVVMSGAVGKDAPWPVDQLSQRNVGVSAIRKLDNVPTGRAFIQIAEDGENSIVLLKGANFHPDPEGDDPSTVFKSLSSPATHLIVQNEIPLETTKRFIAYAHSSSLSTRCTTIFNPSPMLTKRELCSFPWSDVDVLIVNEGEGRDLLDALSEEGDKSAQDADQVLDKLDRLPVLQSTSWIVVTKGSKGVMARVRIEGEEKERKGFAIPPGKPKQVIDTTGAGDTFAGNLVAGMMRVQDGQHLNSSSALTGSASLSQEDQTKGILEWASAAAAIAVEKKGAMESIPSYREVEARGGKL